MRPDREPRHYLAPRFGGDPQRATRSGSSVMDALAEDAWDGSESTAPLPSTPSAASVIDDVRADFTARWQRGESPRAEDYLDRLACADPDDLVELIYHEYCLIEAAGRAPEPSDYRARFPGLGARLDRLFHLHGALSLSYRGLTAQPPLVWPEPGDLIGPYRLRRELGRGGLGRVFLAEQADLANRLLVVKVTSHDSGEPRLLARVRHPHIVEVLRHATTDDGVLHLVCMPFLGGATLATILAEQRRRGWGDPARSGRDWLAVLDRVAAPEFPAARLARPAREILARLTYPKALAWIVARLAEALDHAHRQGVAHGDLKPSNILITADGHPMLLDFNLAVDWQAADASEPIAETGGTLAYLAPERLRALAAAPDRTHPTPPGPLDRQRADLYALGLVLREALTGEPPEVPDQFAGSPRELAGRLAALREREDLTRASYSCRAIPPALRAILARCLAPNPARRYHRADELAEDLDRWRADRPLRFAAEPRLGSVLPRWVRRQRRALGAASLILVVGAFTTLAACAAFQSSMRTTATAELARLWGGLEPGVFRFRWLGNWLEHHQEEAGEAALRHLTRFAVADPGDWRRRDHVRALDEHDRHELEMWLAEQAWRLARALSDRPHAPDDWQRALTWLDRTAAWAPAEPMEPLRRHLRQRLDLPEPPRVVATAAPDWMRNYLLGVVAEPLHAREALRHYRLVLDERPDSFWAHYRAATVAYRLGLYPEAVDHLEGCLDQSPDNPALRVQMAACLYQMDRLDEALELCNQALTVAPDSPEAYYNRAFILTRLGWTEARQADLDRFTLLTRPWGLVASRKLHLDLTLVPGVNPIRERHIQDEIPRQILAADPADVEMRTLLAARLAVSGHTDDALKMFDKILDSEPDFLWARLQRATLHHQLGHDEVVRDDAFLIAHPRIEELLHDDVSALRAFHRVSRHHLRQGRDQQALEVARRSLAFADQLQGLRGESHYAVGLAYAVASRSDPHLVTRATFHLRQAFHHEAILSRWFAEDPLIEDLRPALQAALRRPAAGM